MVQAIKWDRRHGVYLTLYAYVPIQFLGPVLSVGLPDGPLR